MLAVAALVMLQIGAANAQPILSLTGGPWTWTGGYVGFHGGLAAATERGTLGYNDPLAPGVTAADIFANTSRNMSPSGWFGGAQAGYNQQFGYLVLGAEADLSIFDARASTSATTIDTLTTWTLGSHIKSLATARVRLGVALNSVLVYATAGLAMAEVGGNHGMTCVGCAFTPWAGGSSAEVHNGSAFGGGVEWRFAERWTVRAEYLVADLGTAKHMYVGTSHSGTVLQTPPYSCRLYTITAAPASSTICKLRSAA
jgi:outer membrane immunogenic protein